MAVLGAQYIPDVMIQNGRRRFGNALFLAVYLYRARFYWEGTSVPERVQVGDPYTRRLRWSRWA